MKHARLPKYIKPERYRLFIKPDLDRFVFNGEETIYLTVEKPASEIVLHAKELKITEVKYQAASIKHQAAKIIYDQKSETATFKFNQSLPKGKGELSLKFQGVLNDKMRGFYRSQYLHKGKVRHMATTQFEATDARRAFPCIDEPAAKAVFDVTIMAPKSMKVISNTLEEAVTEHSSGYQAVKFAPTPKMSTYLLAFIVGDFEYVEGRTKDKVLVRVFVTPGKKHQAQFALKTAIKVLEFFNSYFDIPYPLPVLDLIAIPDFSHGAMENWGAVTYRESALLVDPEHSSAANKQWVALVIAHELAHQWFGNLVTMEWWTHLWLNEGFASYIEYLAVNELFPQWDIWTQFAYNDLGVAMDLDALNTTHPIEVPVGHPNEIGEIFDEISYSKGASIIRMLAGYLGHEAFRDGLRHYLKKHAYQNASTEHLWQAFEKISKKPVGKIMSAWTSKPGYPSLRVIEEKNHLLIKQSRFFSSPESRKKQLDRTVWQIPLNILDSKERFRQFLMKEKTLKLPKPKADWFKLNIGETGFFRTDYPSQVLSAMHKPLAKKQLKATDRLGIVRDVFAHAEAGQGSTVQALNALLALKSETDYTVWVEIASGLNSVKHMLFNTPAYGDFALFCQSLFAEIGSKLGWKAQTNSHTESLLRSLVLGQLAQYGHQPTISEGLKLFNSSKPVPPDIRAVIYQIAAQQGQASTQKLFMKRYISETLSEEKNRLGRALGQFASEQLLKNTLEFAMSKNVRIQDTASIFAAVWANPNGKKAAWEFTKKHWKTLLTRYPASGHMLSRFIKPAGNIFDAALAKNLAAYFKQHKAPGAKMAVNQTMEKIRSNLFWKEREAEKISDWLKTLN